MKEIDLSHQFRSGSTIATADSTSFRFIHHRATIEINPAQAVRYVQNVDKLKDVGFVRHSQGVWLMHGCTHVDLPVEAFNAITQLIEQAYLDPNSPYKL